LSIEAFGFLATALPLALAAGVLTTPAPVPVPVPKPAPQPVPKQTASISSGQVAAGVVLGAAPWIIAPFVALSAGRELLIKTQNARAEALRKLEAMMIVSDLDETYILSGIGDVMIPEHDVAAIGSGGNYALSAALALKRVNKDMDVKEIAQIAMQIAGETCIYTNTNLSFETLTEEDLKNIED